MQLTNLPRGSGEVELMGLLPIFYVYDYIEQSEQWGKIREFGDSVLLKRKLKQGRSCFYTTLKKIIPGLGKYDKSMPVIFTYIYISLYIMHIIPVKILIPYYVML